MFDRRILLACGLWSVGVPLAFLNLSASPPRLADEQPIATSAPSNAKLPIGSNSPQAVAAMPDVNGVINGSSLYGVSCVSASDCWAVGFYGNDFDQTLIEHWDGASWSIVPSPNKSPTSFNELFSVACVSSTDCWAVGSLIEHWDGNSWSIVDSPFVSFGTLYGVTCASVSECWAVGQGFNVALNQTQTLIERWDGISWTVVNSPNASTGQNRLLSATCVSASDCWVAGDFIPPGGRTQTLFEHWNGQSWSVVNSPSPGASFNNLRGVACGSASQCWGVGGYDFQVLIEKWDGNSWTIASPPYHGLLQSVSCNSTSDCWAVGSSGNPAAPIEHWNANSWTVFPAPNGDPGLTALHGVSCISTSDCWAVGDFQFGDRFETLIEHWNGNVWSITPTPPSFKGAVSRATHGGAGAFDVALPGIECRSGGPNGSYQLVFSFLNTLVNVSSAGVSIGNVDSSSFGPNPNQYTVNLSAVPNAQYVTVTLKSVQDTSAHSGDVSTRMDLLMGDTNGDGHVNASDVAQTQSRVGQPVTTGTFASDVNATGTVNATDVAIVKSSIGSALP